MRGHMTMLRVFLQCDEIFDRNRNDKLKKCLVAGWILGVKPKICFFSCFYDSFSSFESTANIIMPKIGNCPHPTIKVAKNKSKIPKGPNIH